MMPMTTAKKKDNDNDNHDNGDQHATREAEGEKKQWKVSQEAAPKTKRETSTEGRINHPDTHHNYVKRMMNIYFRLPLASGLNREPLPATYLTPHTWPLLVSPPDDTSPRVGQH